MQRSALALLTLLSMLLVPTMAQARGGTGGGGTATTPPVVNDSPCVVLFIDKPTDRLNTAGKTTWSIPLSARINNCSAAAETVTIQVSDVAYENWGGYDCSIPTFSAGPYSLKSGDTKSFSFSTPEPITNICTHFFTERVIAADGTVLATGTARVDSVQML